MCAVWQTAILFRTELNCYRVLVFPDLRLPAFHRSTRARRLEPVGEIVSPRNATEFGIVEEMAKVKSEIVSHRWLKVWHCDTIRGQIRVSFS